MQQDRYTGRPLLPDRDRCLRARSRTTAEKAAILIRGLKVGTKLQESKRRSKPDCPPSIERRFTHRVDDKGCRDQVVGIEA